MIGIDAIGKEWDPGNGNWLTVHLCDLKEEARKEVHEAEAEDEIKRFSAYFEIFKRLVDSGAVRSFSLQSNGSSVLAWASALGQIEAVKHLLSVGARIDDGSRPPLCEAACRGQLEMVKYLAESGANLDELVGESGFTAHQEGARCGHLEVVRYLFEEGADFAGEPKSGFAVYDCIVMPASLSLRLQFMTECSAAFAI